MIAASSCSLSAMLRVAVITLSSICASLLLIWDAHAQMQDNVEIADGTPEGMYDLSVPNDTFWGTGKTLSKVEPYRVLFFGDSILSGYGLERAQDTIIGHLKTMHISTGGIDMIFRNMSHPGETTSGAVTRIKYAIARQPDILVLAIGGNDALRGVDPDVLYNNLNIILRDLARSGIYTMFVGMQAPPSMGYTYMSKFNSVYAKLSEMYPVFFMPFLLEDVAGDKMLNQRDGIHPNMDGTRVIADNMRPYFKRMVEQVRRARRKASYRKLKQKRMISENKRLAKYGIPPRYSQQEIDEVLLK